MWCVYVRVCACMFSDMWAHLCLCTWKLEVNFIYHPGLLSVLLSKAGSVDDKDLVQSDSLLWEFPCFPLECWDSKQAAWFLSGFWESEIQFSYLGSRAFPLWTTSTVFPKWMFIDCWLFLPDTKYGSTNTCIYVSSRNELASLSPWNRAI